MGVRAQRMLKGGSGQGCGQKSGVRGFGVGSGHRQRPHSVRGPQRVPLGNGPPRVGQHVRPVPEASPAGRGPYSHPPDGLVLAKLVVVQHGQLHLDLLGWAEGETGEWGTVTPGGTWGALLRTVPPSVSPGGPLRVLGLEGTESRMGRALRLVRQGLRNLSSSPVRFHRRETLRIPPLTVC